MTYDMPAPTLTWECPFKGCDRVVGPYYSSLPLNDARGDHLRVQHASAIDIREREPGDARIAGAATDHKTPRRALRFKL